jgi:hypothetical protein
MPDCLHIVALFWLALQNLFFSTVRSGNQLLDYEEKGVRFAAVSISMPTKNNVLRVLIDGFFTE